MKTLLSGARHSGFMRTEKHFQQRTQQSRLDKCRQSGIRGVGNMLVICCDGNSRERIQKLYGREADLSETHLVNFFYHDGLTGILTADWKG